MAQKQGFGGFALKLSVYDRRMNVGMRSKRSLMALLKLLSSCPEHDVDVVAEFTFIEVAPEFGVCHEVSDSQFYSRTYAEQDSSSVSVIGV